MKKNTVLWSLALFVLMPIAYYCIFFYAFIAYNYSKYLNISLKTADYIIFIISVGVIITINVLTIKKISKKK